MTQPAVHYTGPRKPDPVTQAIIDALDEIVRLISWGDVDQEFIDQALRAIERIRQVATRPLDQRPQPA